MGDLAARSRNAEDTILGKNVNDNDVYKTPMANLVAAKDIAEHLNLGADHPEAENLNRALLLLKTAVVQHDVVASSRNRLASRSLLPGEGRPTTLQGPVTLPTTIPATIGLLKALMLGTPSYAFKRNATDRSELLIASVVTYVTVHVIAVTIIGKYQVEAYLSYGWSPVLLRSNSHSYLSGEVLRSQHRKI